MARKIQKHPKVSSKTSTEIRKAVEKVKQDNLRENIEDIILLAINSNGEERTIAKKATKQILDLIKTK